MCGIFGSVEVKASRSRLEQTVADGLKYLNRRGPDGFGTFFEDYGDSCLGLGHTRLAIIDPSSNGSQPMHSLSGDTVIVFNGEIYNFQALEAAHFGGNGDRSGEMGSDTRVLVELWEKLGEACLPLLRGMFSFAVLERKKRRLTLVRDQFGIKPLSYRASRGGFTFSSSFASLTHNADGIDNSVVADFLIEDRYDRYGKTFLREIRSLKPGHLISLVVDDSIGFDSIAERQWAVWGKSQSSARQSFSSAQAKLRSLFLEAVELQLISDRPLAFALSGGVDSSAIVCAARHIRPKMEICTFSYTPLGFHNDESKWAQLVSTRAQTKHTTVNPTKDELHESLEDFLTTQEEPVDHTRFLAQYMVFKAAGDAGFKVLLEGQGADEVLGGYHGYPGDKVFALYEEKRWLEIARFLFSLKRAEGRSMADTLAASLLRITDRPRSQLERYKLTVMRTGQRIENYIDLHHPGLVEAMLEASPPLQDRTANPYNRALVHSATVDLLPRILRHGDRNAMAHSIENRVPFLDQKFAQFAIGLPHDWLYPGGWQTKWIFREAMRGLVPDAILDRRDKIGFDAPFSMLPELQQGLKGSPRWGGVPTWSKLNERDRQYSLRRHFLQLWCANGEANTP